MKKLRSIVDPIFWLLFSLVLGYSFSAALMKGLLPDSWAMPDTLLSGVGFFFVLRWLRTTQVPQRKPVIKDFNHVRCTKVRRHKSVWKGLCGHKRPKQVSGVAAHAARRCPAQKVC